MMCGYIWETQLSATVFFYGEEIGAQRGEVAQGSQAVRRGRDPARSVDSQTRLSSQLVSWPPLKPHFSHGAPPTTASGKAVRPEEHSVRPLSPGWLRDTHIIRRL